MPAHPLIDLITSPEPSVRNRPLDGWAASTDLAGLLAACEALDRFRRDAQNLYDRVRALFFLAALHRYHLPPRLATTAAGGPDRAGVLASHTGLIPFSGFEHLLHRRFEEAIDGFLAEQRAGGPSDGLCSALATAYHRLAFQTLADQVRRSVRTVRGNQWMFRMGHPADQPLRLRPELLQRSADGTHPILRERTPVRMDLTHSAWSDIFFLGMDYPEGARVLNLSVDLGVHGRDAEPRPPVSAWLRVLDEPVLRLTSVDLGATADIASLGEVFDFAKDHLGLLKAAVIASGLVPPGIEGSGRSLADLLARIVGPGLGLELCSCVNDIPKGSRLAVSTNLLGSLISVCMRATGQAGSLTGPLEESERRLVLARALLGEWLGGSGGGWQDSGGIWPGIKLITGVAAGEGDAEFGVSRGCLMPTHHVFSRQEIPESSRRALMDSLVVVHGGMAQNVGPILEMVTEKYLLRSEAEWAGRQEALGVLDEVIDALQRGDIRAVAKATTRNFRRPIQTIIPWASNAFTERLIARCETEFGDDFWGFWMLGGMSGGGMGFIFAPARKAQALSRLRELMLETKRSLAAALPFAMDPVVFDYAINEHGTVADLLAGDEALMPPGYYALTVPALLRADRRSLTAARRAELDRVGMAARSRPELAGLITSLFETLLPRPRGGASGRDDLRSLLERNGFDPAQHEQIRSDLREGRIGLAQNRLRTDSRIEDVADDDLVRWDLPGTRIPPEALAAGEAALRAGEVAVVTLAAGAGSRWTGGAGTCKALHPFAKLAGRHRTFIETHLAKSRRSGRLAGHALPHLFSTSYLTHGPTEAWLREAGGHGYPGPLLLSPGRSVGLRLVPTERDLRFAWEEMPQQVLDVQQQKVRESLRSALIGWARSAGEASDYTDNLPLQCLHPVGHFFEVPNLFRNGVLAGLLGERPQLKYLLLHNIDTLGASVDPGLLGQHLLSGACLTFEVIGRRLEDRGGGLARVNGRARLVEGLAMPREEDEFRLRFYNSMTTWIHLDRLLEAFGLTRADILGQDDARISAAIRGLAGRLPTYVTLKEVKKRWGHGQEDVFPVTQFEKLWGDLSALDGIDTRFVAVPRIRGQQLKDPAQLDGWLRDGSAGAISALCDWEE
ncbi:MAG: UTP--glucose-1-phosphate uridylyltransferase [Verrucomicrobium sp.]|nr:UTP--glucose-1-phosphate uridylyltransferase [Verrucomicrobium sp.]